jgi:hypothetical protein
MLNHDLNVI